MAQHRRHAAVEFVVGRKADELSKYGVSLVQMAAPSELVARRRTKDGEE
jgi:hypothetical protein